MHHAHAINRIKSIRHFRVDSGLPLLCRRKTFIRLSFAFLLSKQNVFILSRSDFYGLHNIFASNDLHNKKIFLVPQYFIVSRHNLKKKKKHTTGLEIRCKGGLPSIIKISQMSTNEANKPKSQNFKKDYKLPYTCINAMLVQLPHYFPDIVDKVPNIFRRGISSTMSGK